MPKKHVKMLIEVCNLLHFAGKHSVVRITLLAAILNEYR
jgi:hypothetical protein